MTTALIGRSPDLWVVWAILIALAFLFFAYPLRWALDKVGDWVESRRQPKVGAAGLRQDRQRLDAVVRISERRPAR